MSKRHPIQPTEEVNGVIRFKENKIVTYLLDNGGIDMNNLAVIDFTDEDREQFAQLIGYSLSGAGGLSYMSDETYSTAEGMAEVGFSETAARIEYLQTTLSNVKGALSKIVPELFSLHPDDLGG